MIKIFMALILLAPPVPSGAHSGLDWDECPEGTLDAMECADLDVPVDAAKPAGRRLTLKLGRLPATGTAKGSVLVNLGGPTGQQIKLMSQYGYKSFAGLRRTRNIVVWDPRGYSDGQSRPHLECRGLIGRRIPTIPQSDAEFDRVAAQNNEAARECRTTDRELFDHMDSASHAHDMDAIRRALGDDRLTLHMTSYGGMFGQAYARLFPDRVAAMYLDGTINHSVRRWDREIDAFARDREQAMRRYFDAAGAAMEIRWRRLVAGADRSPIQAGEARYNGQHLQFFGVALAVSRQWDKLTGAITRAEEGDASGFAPGGPLPYPALGGIGVTECGDFPRYKDYRRLVRTTRRLERIAPSTGRASMASSLLLCQGWPVPVSNPPRPLPKGLPPLLGAGTWGDHAATDRIVRQVRGSASIYLDGPGHGLYLSENTCVIGHADRYLTTGRLPDDGTQCPAPDRRPG